MATKKVWVNVREARLFQQRLSSQVGATTWKDLINFINNDVDVMVKAWKELDESELYNAVGWDIQKEAERIVEEKCKPEWNRISDEMKPLGERRNELAKRKSEGGPWAEREEEELKELDKKMADLTNEYQKVTDEANAELNEYKEKRINEEQWAAFFLSEKDYKIIGWYAGF